MHPHIKCDRTVHTWALEGNGKLSKYTVLVVDKVCGLWLTTHQHKEFKKNWHRKSIKDIQEDLCIAASVCNEMCEWPPHRSSNSTGNVIGRQSSYVYSHSTELWKRRFKCINMRSVIKFHVILGKMPCKCHNLLKEDSGIHIRLNGTVWWRVNAIMLGGKMQQMPTAVICLTAHCHGTLSKYTAFYTQQKKCNSC